MLSEFRIRDTPFTNLYFHIATYTVKKVLNLLVYIVRNVPISYYLPIPKLILIWLIIWT